MIFCYALMCQRFVTKGPVKNLQYGCDELGLRSYNPPLTCNHPTMRARRLQDREVSISRRNRATVRTLVVLALASISVAGLACRRAVTNSDSIRVGIISSFTGSEAKFGFAHKLGYEMSVDEINSSGGVLGKRLELVYQDDTSRPE